MAKNIINVGDKLDLWRTEGAQPGGKMPQVFRSMVEDIQKDGRLEVGVPMAGGRITAPSIGSRYDILVYTKSGIFRGLMRVTNRARHEGRTFMVLEPLAEYKKYQRREYYRHDCLISIGYIPLTEEEVALGTPKQMLAAHLQHFPDEGERSGTVLDISGGGLRFTSAESWEDGAVILIYLNLHNDRVNANLMVPGKILRSKRLDHLKAWEYNVEFVLDDNEGIREKIIKFVFEEERKSRWKT